MIDNTVAKMAKWIAERDRFAVLPHVMPDGDALGSALSLCDALKRFGKEAFIACVDTPPGMYSFMPGTSAVLTPEQRPFDPDWLILVDVASAERVGALLPWLDKVKGYAVIDHHATNPRFGSINCIDPYASSTGELIGKLIKALGLEITQDAALWLYVAISTDTGNFSFPTTTPSALRLIAEFVEKGLDIGEYNRLLFRCRTQSRTLLLGAALNEIKMTSGGKIAYSSITQAMMDRCGAITEDKEGIVNYLNEIAGVEAAVLADERGEETKVSLRSNGLIDVGDIAASLGGGGHERAAGVSMYMPIEEAMDIVLDLLVSKLKA